MPIAHARRLAPLVVACMLFTACADPTEPGPPAPLTALPRALTAAERTLVDGSNGFAFGITREVASRVPATENVFVSPLSVSMALGMAANGAAGETQRQMRDALGIGALAIADANAASRSLIDLLRSVDRGVDFRIANAAWADAGFTVRPEFLGTVKAYYDADSRSLPFDDPATLTTMNAWVKRATNGKIETVVEDIPRDAVLFLVNAIYFKGSWRDRFDAAKTRPTAFHAADGTTASVATMHQEGDFAYARVGPLQAVHLPYARGAFVMTVVVPDSGIGADSALALLTPDRWQAITAAQDTQAVELALPRFTLRTEYSLNAPLQSLGMRDAFTDHADFSSLSPTGGVAISEVHHKAFVAVDEEGTEAAAVTSVGFAVTSVPQRVRFTVDRPFVFVLRERFSGAILFVGRIAKL